jgi:hypothetical protein
VASGIVFGPFLMLALGSLVAEVVIAAREPNFLSTEPLKSGEKTVSQTPDVNPPAPSEVAPFSEDSAPSAPPQPPFNPDALRPQIVARFGFGWLKGVFPGRPVRVVGSARGCSASDSMFVGLDLADSALAKGGRYRV